MISEKSLVIYKNRPAIVTGRESEKINITVFAAGGEKSGGGQDGCERQAGEAVRVREKDVELLHPGPCSGPPNGVQEVSDVRETWELLAETAEASTSCTVSLKELAELVYGAFTPDSAWAAWELLNGGGYFTGSLQAIKARTHGEVAADEKKREEKGRESQERAAFLEKLTLAEAPPEEARRFLQDVEALALGKTSKSRTMKELGRSETPEEAHRLLLSSGAWTVWVNPHPDRFGLHRESATLIPPPSLEEDRLDLTGLDAFAIDNPWSSDPDDAVSLAGPDAEGGYDLWVHVADPASAILPGSPADREAMGRGSSLYLPEGASHMLSKETLSRFALGQEEISPALSMRLSLLPDLTIGGVEITPSRVRVTRLGYAEADRFEAAPLEELAKLTERRLEKRLQMGAVVIDFPEVHIEVDSGKSISIEPIPLYRSALMIRECMILAGEGAARWALQRQLTFPYISQETGELPEKPLPDLAGCWQLRRCMRPRNLSTIPGIHWGLGLDGYSQVTSPLRRYTDLLCHQQIRAALGSGAYKGLKPLGEEEVLFRIRAAEAAASAVSSGERASRAFWLAVYLSDKKDSVWEGVVLEKKTRAAVMIPALGLETQVVLKGEKMPNDRVNLSLLSVKIPEGEAVFSIV